MLFPDEHPVGFEFTAAHVTAGPVQFDLVTAGDGPALLYLHPELGGRDSEAFIGQLARRFKVYAPSHPGYDDARAPAYFRGVDDLALSYLDLLERLDLKDVVVVGVAMGAWIATQIAVHDHSRIKCLVLASPVGVKFGPRDQRDIADVFSLTRQEFDELAYADPTTAAARYADMGDAQMNRLAGNYEATARYAWLPYMYDPKLIHRLHRIRVPTLCLQGANDRVLSQDYADRFARALPQGACEVMAAAGHYPHIEQPLRLANRIVSFAASQRANASSTGAA